MHAVVIDIANDGDVDGNPMFEYLTQHLSVPKDHVRHVLGSDPKRILAALHSLVKNPAIPRGSPIIIYISHHSERNGDSEWIGDNEQDLSYAMFFELVRRISETKGENVVSRVNPSAPLLCSDASVQAVILDTNFPALETGSEHQSEPHVLLTACSTGQSPKRGRLFTQELLSSLEQAAADKLSYEEVVKNVAKNL
jgi:hypothetical protein